MEGGGKRGKGVLLAFKGIGGNKRRWVFGEGEVPGRHAESCINDCYKSVMRGTNEKTSAGVPDQRPKGGGGFGGAKRGRGKTSLRT